MILKLKESVDFLNRKLGKAPKIGIILGSGLGDFVNKLTEVDTLSYEAIPHFKTTSVEGHLGQLISGKIKNTPVIACQGRVHAYEGYDLEQVVWQIRTLGLWGVKKLIITNAAGGINNSYRPGDLVVITDHINLTGKNPLIGPNYSELGPRFPDMTEAYNLHLRELAFKAGQKSNVALKSGIYCGLMGPTYETPAEIRMLKTMGADLVGMSTVNEVIAANHMGLQTLGISCVTNLAAGFSGHKLDHQEVKDQALLTMDRFTRLLTEVIPMMI